MDNMKRRTITILGLLLFLPFIFGFGEVANNVVDVSLVNLIATPEKYNGKTVRVIGISNIEFEGNAIYLSREHLLNGVTKNALWISLNSQAIGKTEEELSKYNGQYALVEGVFKKGKYGHMGLFSGSIDNITRFMPWPPQPIKIMEKNG